jgi:uncharacterized cupredoxin-like copper-binding protein
MPRAYLAASAVAVAILLTSPTAITIAPAHDDHTTFSAGEPGDPKKPARTIKVKMLENDKKMLFQPARIEVRRGEQIRFILENDGTESHEFILATIKENQKHAELMKKFPEMEHDDPNGKRLPMAGNGELLWKFTKRGEFEFACMIPGHYEAGMHGKIIVK